MRFLRRRDLLAGLTLGAGQYLLAPLCRSLAPAALGQPATRGRLILYVTTFGSFRPKAGATETAFVLPEGFAALEPYRAELTWVDGLYNPFNQDLHGNRWALSVAPEPQFFDPYHIGPTPAPDVSFDRLLARTFGKDDPWPSLNLGVVSSAESGGRSVDGPGKVFPLQRDPVKAYATIFSAPAPAVDPAAAAAAAKARLAREQSLLDYMRGDIARMKARLAGPERAKVDQYLESVRGMETRLAALAKGGQSGCAKPAAPDAALAKITPSAAHVAAFHDIALSALFCGLTRVVVMYHAGEPLPFLGEDGRIGHHHQWHDQGTPAKHLKFEQFHAQQLASLRKRLGDTRDAAGTFADSTLTMVVNESGGIHHFGHGDIPLLLFGKAGGLRGGRYVRYPKMTRLVSDAFLTAANAIGAPMATFGKKSNGPLPL